MPSFTIKDFPEDLYQQLKQSAARNRRSMKQEAIVCLERAFHILPSPRTPEEVQEMLAEARRLREYTKGKSLTAEEIHAAIHEGRE